ncbi:MAG: MoxR family ATPase [Bacteroidetes bacterium]|nr:MAG: MoxR family ATPase [Bacteroidota bacterium]PTM08692.1 MAG: MoxR family ATPase [Bacteroidota bacterium]
MPNTPYILSLGQEHALNAALKLNQPLLLTGEPGTGKTMMAAWALEYLNAKYDNSFYPEVLRFMTKTTSKASDLLYSYDALSHFQAANLRGEKEVETAHFIELQALGKAIALSNPRADYKQLFRWEMPEQPMNAVVLIDEVDKAPRDFTNDLLDELVYYRFSVKEQDGAEITKAKDAKIVVIMTSNSDKNLPDAFLRRSAFYHIKFPEGEHLKQIVAANLGQNVTEHTQEAYDRLFEFFHQVRGKAVRKKPATAELIAWLRLLGDDGYLTQPDAAIRRQLVEQNLSFLVKTREDLEAIDELIKAANL